MDIDDKSFMTTQLVPLPGVGGHFQIEEGVYRNGMRDEEKKTDTERVGFQGWTRNGWIAERVSNSREMGKRGLSKSL